MMQDAIRDFAKQFLFLPEIVNEDKLIQKNKFVVCGMGGSHLAGDVLKDVVPELEIYIHRMYGLPNWRDEELEQSLIIASSYSGNTEEVIDAYDKAQEKGLALCVIAVGGKLIEKAKQDGVPYIQMPDTGIQPRSALGYSFLSLLKMIGQEDMLKEAGELASVLQPEKLEAEGKALADRIIGKVPVIYTSDQYYSMAYNWKIKFNETGKIPAFYNVLPELNHNEMTGYDVQESSKELSSCFYFIFLKNEDDHPRVQKRMEILEQLYTDRGLSVEVITVSGANKAEKIFSSLLLADWTAVNTAENYGLEAEQVPMVEEFKKLMAK